MPIQLTSIAQACTRVKPSGKMLGLLKQRLSTANMAPPRQFVSDSIDYKKGQFAIIGDLQSTSKVEFWRKSNTQERHYLIHQIAAEAPDFLAIVGDLVFAGSSPTHWAGFDTLAAPLSEAQVPILPLLGNHDYGMIRRSGLANFFARFPHLGGRHWFSRTYGPLGLIFLDSNIRRLPALQWQAQCIWYKNELQRFEQMSEVRGVLVLLHHPPYTNSAMISDGIQVQRTFVQPFVEARKTLAMVAGHVHSYERFERTGKTFLVTGGGGPRVKLATGRRRRHTDDCFGGPRLRGFHFLRLTPSPTRLAIEMCGLQQPQCLFETLDTVSLPWASMATQDTQG